MRIAPAPPALAMPLVLVALALGSGGAAHAQGVELRIDIDNAAASEAGLEDVNALQADLEYAVRMQEGVKRVFDKWLKVHIAISFVLYALLVLHVWSSIHFGLRWLT